MKVLRNRLANISYAAHCQSAKDSFSSFLASALDAYDMVAGLEPRVISVWGTPNVGKSTLINSIMGKSILPTDPDTVIGCVVDLINKPDADEYRIDKREGERSLGGRACSCEADARSYLKELAAHEQPDESDNIRIVVEGPFSSALSIMGGKDYVLRDTPVVESGDVMTEKSNRALRRARAALEEKSFPIFCVSGKTLGQEEDRDFYEKFFKHRLCLHVITHCDKQEVMEKRTSNFRRDFGALNENLNPRLVTCVGVDASQIRMPNKLLSIGLADLATKVNRYLTRDFMSDTLRSIAQKIVQDSQGENGQWNNAHFGFRIHAVDLQTLQSRLETNQR